ncbi:MAG: hypothetical protein E5W97_21590 [Mesorhizobium sp.]|nr:MAG: hypothetical protein E5W97_21590 [Mesorhizobium sp.]
MTDSSDQFRREREFVGKVSRYLAALRGYSAAMLEISEARVKLAERLRVVLANAKNEVPSFDDNVVERMIFEAGCLHDDILETDRACLHAAA